MTYDDVATILAPWHDAYQGTLPVRSWTLMPSWQTPRGDHRITVAEWGRGKHPFRDDLIAGKDYAVAALALLAEHHPEHLDEIMWAL